MKKIPLSEAKKICIPEVLFGVSFWVSLTIGGCIVLLSRDLPFFWDTIQLASKHAHFFFENNFSGIWLPQVLDSGHPPVFGMYMAFLWKIFGKSLMVSHFGMLPFISGTLYFLWKTGGALLGENRAFLLPAAVVADPVWASQSVLVSPDVALVCFFSMGLWAVFCKRNSWLALAVVGLALVSMRGMMTAAGLFFLVCFQERKQFLQHLLQCLLPFLPGGIVAAAWLFFHWLETGWIGYHAQSTWAPSYEKVDMVGFARNIAVAGWRFLDFGRIFVWAVAGYVLWSLYKRKGHFATIFTDDRCFWNLAFLNVVLIFTLTLPQLFYKALLAHRYLLPSFISLTVMVLYIIFMYYSKNDNSWKSSLLTMLILLGLGSGNRWIYPAQIAQGWDSTLAHLPWYGLSEAANEFIKEQNIAPHSVGTAFPHIGPQRYFYLNDDTTGFREKDLEENCFIFYSNIMNDFSEQEITLLQSEWQPVFHRRRAGIYVTIFKNPRNRCEN